MGTPAILTPTVTLKNQATAWKEIQSAISKTISNYNKGLNKQTRVDLQTQAEATTDAAALQLVSDQLNGPVAGYQIPSEFELYVPLRQVMQQSTNFPCGSNPFDNDIYDPNDNPAPLTGSPPASPPIDYQFNYILQRLMYLSLHTPFVNDLKGYQNYTDLYLEDEALSDLEKKITTDINSYLNATDMLQWLTTAWNIQQTSPPQSPPSQNTNGYPISDFGGNVYWTTQDILPEMTSDQYNQVRTWLSVQTNITKINEITSQYITAITGPDSTVFPPPNGKTFLENLSALLYGNIKAQMSPALVAVTNVNVQIDSDLATMLSPDGSDKTTVVNTLPVIQNGIDITLFEQLVGVGIQGMLLADIYDYEKALDFQQSLTYMLNTLPQYTSFTAAANTEASAMAQSILAVRANLNSYYSQWTLTQVTIAENAAISGGTSGDNINTTLNNDYNGIGTPQMGQYLTYLLEPTTGNQQALIDEAEDYSTNISVQLAGLNFIAQTVMTPTTTLNQVNALVTSINTQVQSDITQMQNLFTSYASATATWLTNQELYTSNNDVVVAQMNVSTDVNNVINLSNQPKAN